MEADRVLVPLSFSQSYKERPLLTESEVSRSWARLFKDGNFTTESFGSAENLLDELRPESPLRHRLSSELIELQKIHGAEIEA